MFEEDGRAHEFGCHNFAMEALAVKPKSKPKPKVVELEASPEMPNNLIWFSLLCELREGFVCGLVQKSRFDSDQRCGESTGLID